MEGYEIKFKGINAIAKQWLGKRFSSPTNLNVYILL